MIENVDEFKDFRGIPEKKQKPLVRMTHSKSFKHHYRLPVRRLRKGKAVRGKRRGSGKGGNAGNFPCRAPFTRGTFRGLSRSAIASHSFCSVLTFVRIQQILTFITRNNGPLSVQVEPLEPNLHSDV